MPVTELVSSPSQATVTTKSAMGSAVSAGVPTWQPGHAMTPPRAACPSQQEQGSFPMCAGFAEATTTAGKAVHSTAATRASVDRKQVVKAITMQRYDGREALSGRLATRSITTTAPLRIAVVLFGSDTCARNFGRHEVLFVDLLDFLLPIAFAIVALLYASAGQAGGTGYVAVMGVLGFAPDVIKPAALALNILVAGIGCWRFHRTGLLTWRTCYPFAVLGAPFSLLGGATNLPGTVYQPVVGGLLLLAAAQMLLSARGAAAADQRAPAAPPFVRSLIVGGTIGYLSGVTGVGGGIFLAPLVLAFGWIGTRQAAAVSTAFNLLNSAAALAGVWATTPTLPPELPTWLISVGIGALLGSWLAAWHLPPTVMRLVLAALLLVAGLRMLADHVYF